VDRVLSLIVGGNADRGGGREAVYFEDIVGERQNRPAQI
jgi:hypothetical protein